MDQLKENWWKFLIVVLVVLGLVWWRQDSGQEELINPDADVELEDRVNRFLEEGNIELPEGAPRANLEDVSGGESTGVATKQEENGNAEVSVIAGLPELEMGSYQAWLVRGEDEYVRLGRLSQAKGGFLLDTSLSGDYSESDTVVVSREESAVGDVPSTVVLRGTFKDVMGAVPGSE